MVDYKPFKLSDLVNIIGDYTSSKGCFLSAWGFEDISTGFKYITDGQPDYPNADRYSYEKYDEQGVIVGHASYSKSSADDENIREIGHIYSFDVDKEYLYLANKAYKSFLSGDKFFIDWGGREDMFIQILDSRVTSRYALVPNTREDENRMMRNQIQDGTVIAQDLGNLTEVVDDPRFPRPTAIWELLFILPYAIPVSKK